MVSIFVFLLVFFFRVHSSYVVGAIVVISAHQVVSSVKLTVKL